MSTFGEEERHATIVGSNQTKTEAATSSVAAVSMDELVAETPLVGGTRNMLERAKNVRREIKMREEREIVGST